MLAVLKLFDGKDEEVAKMTGEVHTKWNLRNHILTFCFDATAVNTGAKSGVCLRLEMRLEKQLLYFVW